MGLLTPNSDRSSKYRNEIRRYVVYPSEYTSSGSVGRCVPFLMPAEHSGRQGPKRGRRDDAAPAELGTTLGIVRTQLDRSGSIGWYYFQQEESRRKRSLFPVHSLGRVQSPAFSCDPTHSAWPRASRLLPVLPAFPDRRDRTLCTSNTDDVLSQRESPSISPCSILSRVRSAQIDGERRTRSTRTTNAKRSSPCAPGHQRRALC